MKSNRGGKRKGAGRKPMADKMSELRCQLPTEALDMLKGQAKYYEYATIGMYLWSLAKAHNLNWMHEPDTELSDKEDSSKKQFKTGSD